MSRFAASALLLALPLALNACGSNDPAPGGVTANEAKALDDAAEMVEARRLGESALRPAPAAAPGEAAPQEK